MILSKADRDRTKEKLLERVFAFVSCLYSIDDLPEAQYEISRLQTLMQKAKEDAEWGHYNYQKPHKGISDEEFVNIMNQGEELR